MAICILLSSFNKNEAQVSERWSDLTKQRHPETSKTRAGLLPVRPPNQVGTTQAAAPPPNTAFLFAPGCLTSSGILKMERGNYLILWLSTAQSCCVHLPGRRTKGKLFSHLQNKVVRHVIMLGTLEGNSRWKGKTRACFDLLLGCFFPCVSLARPPQTLTQTHIPTHLSPHTPMPCSHSSSGWWRITCLPLTAIALGCCGRELEFQWAALLTYYNLAPSSLTSYSSWRGPGSLDVFVGWCQFPFTHIT